MKKLSICILVFAAFLTGCQKEINTFPEDVLLNTLSVKSSGGSLSSLVQWQKCLGSSGNDNGYGVAKSIDGTGYFVVGSKPGIGVSYTDAYIAKIDAITRNVTWSQTLGGSSNEEFRAVVSTPDGGCLATGYTESSSFQYTSNGTTQTATPHGADVLLVKFSATGDIEWLQTLGGSNYDRAMALTRAGNGVYALAGETLSNDGDATGSNLSGGIGKIWVVNFSLGTSSAIINWQHVYGASNGKDDVAYGIVEKSDGSFVVNGRTLDNSDNADLVTVGIGSDGSSLWTQKFGGSGSDVGFGLTTTADNGVIVTGSTGGTSALITHGQQDMVAVKYDANGVFQWAKAYGGSQGDGGRNIIPGVVNNVPGFILIGSTGSNNGNVSGGKGGDDLWIVQIDSNGNFIKANNFGGNSNDSGYSIIADDTGTYTAVGTTSSKNGDVSGLIGGSDVWAVQVKL
jgi:hypothetical protein